MEKNKLKNMFILILLLVIYIFISAVSYTKAVSYDISNSVFRLHVIANSDSESDQNLKYKVRDAVLEYMKSVTLNITNKEEIIQIASDNLPEFQEIAQNTVYNNGYTYPVTVEIGNFEFPTKAYGDIKFPAGYYDSLRIKIGNAKGQNWWCVMFPPLCFIDVTSGIVPEASKEIVESELNEEEFSLISENSAEVKIKFKIVEVLQNFNKSGIFR